MAISKGKTDWKQGDSPSTVDFNRIEGNIQILSDEKLNLTGGTLSGNLVLNNNVQIRAKKTDGSDVLLCYVDTANNSILGSTANMTKIHSNANPMIRIGSTDYTIYHTGNRPTPAAIGAVSKAGDTMTGDLVIQGSVNPIFNLSGTASFDKTKAGLSINEGSAEQDGYVSTYTTTLTVQASLNRQFQLSANNTASVIAFRSGHTNNMDGTGAGWTAWQRIYHTGYKPTANDVGALTQSTADARYLKLTGGSLTGGLTVGGALSVSVDNATPFTLTRTGTNTNNNIRFVTPTGTTYFGVHGTTLKFGTSQDLGNSPNVILSNGGTFTGEVRINSRLTVAKTGDGAELITLGTERPWGIFQGGSAANASLDLVSSSDGKNFRIMNPTKTKKADFRVENTYVDLTVDGSITAASMLKALNRVDVISGYPYVGFWLNSSTRSGYVGLGAGNTTMYLQASSGDIILEGGSGKQIICNLPIRMNYISGGIGGMGFSSGGANRRFFIGTSTDWNGKQPPGTTWGDIWIQP